MSFADELRRAPAERAAQKQRQDDQDWYDFIQLWYRHIQGECRDCASGGDTRISVSLEDFIRQLDRRGEGWIYSANGELRSVKNREYHMYERLQERIAYRFNDYGDPTDCLSIDDMFDIRDTVTDLLEADGLTVKEEHPSYCISKSGKKWYHLSLDISW